MKNNVEFHPTVVIGLGGTGYGTLTRLKKRFIDKFKAVPPVVQFLSIDTTREAEPGVWAADGETEIRLEQNNESYIVQVEDPNSLINSNNPHIDRWWPTGSSVSAIISGAQQIRARGRLALFANYSEIRARLAQKVDEARKVENIAAMKNYGFRISDRVGVEIYIVSSLAGGTGSGMLLDIAFILRNIAHTSNVTGVFILPRVFARLPGTDLIKTNTYAALKELEHFTQLKDTDTEPPIDYGIDRIQVRQPPFDLTYIIDSINEGERVIEDLKILKSRVADGLYLLIGSAIGTGHSNAIDNIKSHLASAGPVGTHSASYCSFGVASCRWQAEEFIKSYEKLQHAAARKLISDLLQNLSPGSSPQSDAEAFIKQQHLGKGQIPNLFVGLSKHEGGPETSPFSLGSLNFNKDAQSNVVRMREEHVAKEHVRIKDTLSTNSAQIASRFKEDLGKLCGEHLGRNDFLAYSEQFVGELSRQLQALQDELEKRVARARDEISKIGFGDHEDKIEQASGAWFKVNQKIKAACINYKGQVDRHCKTILENERAEMALQLVKDLKSEVEKISREYADVRPQMEKVLGNIEAKRASAAPLDDSSDPFDTVLPYVPQLKELKADVSEFIRWCEERYGSVYQFMTKPLADVESGVIDFVSAGNVRPEDVSIDEVFKDAYKRQQEMARHGQQDDDFLNLKDSLDQVSRLAAPLWRYNNSEIPLTRNPISRLSYCGVRRAEEHHLEPYKGTWRSGDKTEFISTIDRDRITFFDITFGVPLFALLGIKEMQLEYYAKRDNSACHLNRSWGKTFAEIIPIQVGSALGCFAVAQSPDFRFIRRNPAGEYAVYLKHPNGTPKEISLAHGRRDAYNVFERKIDIVQEVKDAIAEKMEGDDGPTLKMKLQQYGNELKKASSSNGSTPGDEVNNGNAHAAAGMAPSGGDYQWPSSPEDKEFLNEEYRAISDLLKRMGSH